MLTLYRLWFRIGSLLWPELAARQAFSLFITPQTRYTKALPPIFEKAASLEWTESGDRCQGWQWNKGGSHRILILHGFSSSARNFGHLIEALVRRNAEVIAFDAPAHGNSEGEKIHSLRYRKLIQEIRQQWGPMDGYIAHSFGGLSLSLALEEKTPRPQERIALIAPATETRSALKQLQTTLGLSDSIMRRIDRLIEIRSGHTVSWFSVNRVVKDLPNPIFWVHDRSDEITPLEDTLPSQQLSRPSLQFRITEGLGHRRIYRDPSVCEQLVDFFNTQLAASMRKIEKYLALGDSYTIGEAVLPEESFPYQLADLLREDVHAVKELRVIAKTGWTTDELMEAIQAADENTPIDRDQDLVTLLIGVNNQYRGRSVEEFSQEFLLLLNLAIEFAGNDPSRVRVLSIPDWGVTPYAADRDRNEIANQIDRFNENKERICRDAGVPYIYITDLTRGAATDSGLLATDGLHPSGTDYARWAKRVHSSLKAS